MSGELFYADERQKVQLRSQAVGLAVQVLGSAARDREQLERTTQMIFDVMVGKESRHYSHNRMVGRS